VQNSITYWPPQHAKEQYMSHSKAWQYKKTLVQNSITYWPPQHAKEQYMSHSKAWQ